MVSVFISNRAYNLSTKSSKGKLGANDDNTFRYFLIWFFFSIRLLKIVSTVCIRKWHMTYEFRLIHTDATNHASEIHKKAKMMLSAKYFRTSNTWHCFGEWLQTEKNSFFCLILAMLGSIFWSPIHCQHDIVTFS